MPSVRWSSEPFILNHSLQSLCKLLLYIWEPCPGSNIPRNEERCSCSMCSFQHTISCTCTSRISQDLLAWHSLLSRLVSVHHHDCSIHTRWNQRGGCATCDDLLIIVAKADRLVCCSKAASVGGRLMSNADFAARNFCVRRSVKVLSPPPSDKTRPGLHSQPKNLRFLQSSWEGPAESLSALSRVSSCPNHRWMRCRPFR